MLPPRSRRTAVVGGIVLAASLVTTACLPTENDDPEPSGDPSRNKGRVIVAGDEYVAMGDSYTAAPLTGPTVADDGCVQSETNYPKQLADTLGLELTDVSCGGADTSSIAGEFVTLRVRETKPPQGDALSASTDLVTVSIGANDDRIYGSLLVCLGLAASDPDGKPCATIDEQATARGDGSPQRLARMEDNLVEVLRFVAGKAPEARIVVVGYPNFVPERTCEQFPVASGDLPWIASINDGLVRAQERAAAEAGAEFLDIYDVTDGHDFCSDDPWVAGAAPDPAIGPAAPYHPYPKVQQVVADRLEALLTSD